MTLRESNEARVKTLAERGAHVTNLAEVSKLAAIDTMLADWLADDAHREAAEAHFDEVLDAQLTVAEAQADQVEAAQRRSRLVVPGVPLPPMP